MQIEDITEEEKNEYLAYHSYEDVINNYESGIKDLRKMQGIKEGVTLLAGAMIAFDKGLSDFINSFYGVETNLFLLSEVTAQYRRYTDMKIDCPHVCTPHLLAKEMVIRGMKIPISDIIRETVEKTTFLYEARLNYRMRYPDLGDDYEICWAYYAYMYLCCLIEKLKPCKVILWNEFYAFHIIFRGLCKEKNIPVEYMEFGCIPGTICIERHGQQGESEVAVHWPQYKYRHVTNLKKENAKKILEYLYLTELNRNVQPVTQMAECLLHNYNQKRQTILFLGQNDSEAGMQPYTEKTKKYHSPIFKSSVEAMEFLEILCIKNNWNFIVKMHPTMNRLGFEVENSRACADIVDDVDINSVIDFADLTITILSQGAYISLIRNKPVIMLGYTQLKNKDCVYEVRHKVSIERTIKKALKKGYTIKQRKAMVKHTAILLDDYLYYDGQERDIIFGKKINNYN